MEPPTKKVLLSQYTDVECRSLFFKAGTKMQREERKAILNEMETLDSSSSDDKEERSAELKVKLDQLKEDEKGGLRLDLQMNDRIANESLWIDCSCVHATCKSRIDKEFNRVNAWLAQQRDSKQPSDIAPKDRKIDPLATVAVEEQAKLKIQTYAPLLDIAHRQVRTGLRTKAPEFVPAICSTFGELGSGMIRVQEWLTRILCRSAVEEDGMKVPELTARFRSNFRSSMLVAIAKGQAQMLLDAGHGRQSLRRR